MQTRAQGRGMRMNILQALDDPKLYGAHPAFARDPATSRPWRAFLGACYGLPLDSEGRELFKRCTGRLRPAAG